MSKHEGKAPIPIFDVQKWTIRMVVATLFGGALLVLAQPHVRPYLLIPGIALAALGCLIRIWGCGHLRKNKFLATGGPYAFVRHPLYVGTFFVLVGLGIMGGSDWVMILLAVAILVYVTFYAPRKERKESGRLERRFGDEFVKYRKAVKSYFPRLTPYPERQGTFAWEGVMINREYLITFAVAFGVAVILAKYFWYTA
ncbi:MAG: isoprenylcysteine carboxylmethyltransferase family protein [Planctomycetota bacterium]